MKIFRSYLVEGFIRKSPSLFMVYGGFAKPIDELSGMSLNMMEIDSVMGEVIHKITEANDHFDYLESARAEIKTSTIANYLKSLEIVLKTGQSFGLTVGGLRYWGLESIVFHEPSNKNIFCKIKALHPLDDGDLVVCSQFSSIDDPQSLIKFAKQKKYESLEWTYPVSQMGLSYSSDVLE